LLEFGEFGIGGGQARLVVAAMVFGGDASFRGLNDVLLE
jgi:hypothetical protein